MLQHFLSRIGASIQLTDARTARREGNKIQEHGQEEQQRFGDEGVRHSHEINDGDGKEFTWQFINNTCQAPDSAICSSSSVHQVK